jgi:hypothetical protein
MQNESARQMLIEYAPETKRGKRFGFIKKMFLTNKRESLIFIHRHLNSLSWINSRYS